MSIKKQFLKSKPACKVTFKVTKNQANMADKVSVVGDFNNWDATAAELNKLKDGSFSQTLELESGKTYQFRYVADGKIWFNDEKADSYQDSGHGNEQNGVLEL